MRILRIGRFSLNRMRLDGNHHGPNGSTLKRTWLYLTLFYDNNNFWGKRIYFYRGDGSNISFDLIYDRRKRNDK